MGSKALLLFGLAFAIVLLITSEVAAARALASDHNTEETNGVEDAKYGGGDRDYRGGNGGDYGRGRGDYGRGRGDNGGGRGYCRWGCCGRGNYYGGGCRCCSSYAEANAYKNQAQPHD